MANKNKKSEKKSKEVKKDYPIILGETKGKLIVSERLEKQINYLHALVGPKEWSGVLVYQIQKGDLDNIGDLVIEAKGVFPMDIGTAGYTEYDFDETNIFPLHDYYPQILEEGWKEGHIHSHHNMKAYFSSTDEGELKDNTPNHAYYLSLIVNFEKKYVARLCVMGNRVVKGNSNVAFKNVLGADSVSSVELSLNQEVVYAIDLDIEIKPDLFFEEVMKLKKRMEDKRKVKQSGWKNSTGGRMFGQQQALFNDVNADPLDVREINNIQYTKEDEYKDQVKDFLYKLISVDVNSTGHLPSLIMRMDHAWNEQLENEKGEFLDSLGENLNEVYEYMFPEDEDMSHFALNMFEIKGHLSEYSIAHEFATELGDYLELWEVKDEENTADALGYNASFGTS